jgi:hypothetical protein
MLFCGDLHTLRETALMDRLFYQYGVGCFLFNVNHSSAIDHEADI